MPRSWFLNTILYLKELEPLGEMAYSEQEQGKYNTSLENFFTPEIKEFLQNNGTYERDSETSLKEPPISNIWGNLSTTLILIDYDLLNKIGILESILK